MCSSFRGGVAYNAACQLNHCLNTAHTTECSGTGVAQLLPYLVTLVDRKPKVWKWPLKCSWLASLWAHWLLYIYIYMYMYMDMPGCYHGAMSTWPATPNQLEHTSPILSPPLFPLSVSTSSQPSLCLEVLYT